MLGELGTGVFELAAAGALGEDLAAPEKEVAWMRRLAAEVDRPVTFALNQNNADPNQWERLLGLTAAAAADGVAVRPQVTARTVSILLGFQTFHPFAFTPVWGQSSLGLLLPWEEQVASIGGDVSLRERLLTEAGALAEDPVVMGFMAPERSYLLGDPPDYEPSGAASVTGIAAARGAGVWETFLALLLADGGRELLNSPVLNYSDGNLDATREMLVHPRHWESRESVALPFVSVQRVDGPTSWSGATTGTTGPSGTPPHTCGTTAS